MERVVFFFLLQTLASTYAVFRGGGPERAVGISLLMAAVIGVVIQSPFIVRFLDVEWGILVIDLILLAVLMAVALNADRYWAMWLAALQALGAGAHFVRGVDGEVARFVYAVLLAGWSYPMILLLIVGTYRHQRRLAANGFDVDWSFRAQS